MTGWDFFVDEAPATGLGIREDLRTPETRLYSDGVVVGEEGPVIVPPHSTYQRHQGTPFLDTAFGDLAGAHDATPEEIRAVRADVEHLDLPGRSGPYADMTETALADIAAVCFPNGAAVAAASPYWRHVWPRDASFMAAALTLVGRRDQAGRILRYLAHVQESDGTWQARYLPDGSGRVPDARGTQLDGNGWFLWATWLLLSETVSNGAPDLMTELWAAARRALVAAILATEHESGVVTPSQDFWEIDLDEPTLGVAAPLLLALRTGAGLALAAGDDALATTAHERAVDLARAIDAQFSPGYPRRLGPGGEPDASVAFLLPPFAPARGHVADAWQSALERMRLPNGGLKPGVEWPDDETAWTPQTSLFAMTASYLGEEKTSERLLHWLDSHRTRLGSLPEKVTAGGRPAAVAPLPLTGATVLLALGAREGRRLPTPDDPVLTSRPLHRTGSRTRQDTSVTDDNLER